MTQAIESKYQALLESITAYRSPAVAYSGGVDSALLLHACVERLGAARVTALLGDSELQVKGRIRRTADEARKRYGPDLGIQVVQLKLLQHPLIATNSRQRCYHCKMLLYQRLQEEMALYGSDTLLDGTNLDDLSEDRPGLGALRELQVAMPLADSGLVKADIRKLARTLALPQANLPANSCLATRFRSGTHLSLELLAEVALLEDFLQQLGLAGCRVRPHPHRAMVVCSEQDFSKIVEDDLRIRIVDFFSSRGYRRVGLDLAGRTIK